MFQRCKEFLNFLIPHLHIVLVNQLFHPRRQANLGWHDCGVPSNFDDLPKEAYVQHGLTQREGQILSWVCAGKTNWEVSRIVNISENTVKNHVQNIYKKLGVNNRTQAAGKVAVRMQEA